MKNIGTAGEIVAASNECLFFLKQKLSPLIMEGIYNIWKDACNFENSEQSYNYVLRFQKFLKDIPHWNQTILSNETERILDKIPLTEYITAIHILHIKILASIKIKRNDDEPISLKMKSPAIIIHSIYTQSAYNIFTQLNVLQAFYNYNERESNDIIKKTIEDSIEEAINIMLPIDDLIKRYLDNFGKQSTTEVSEVPQEPEPEPVPEPINSSPIPQYPLYKPGTIEETIDDFSNVKPYDQNAPTLKFGDNFDPQNNESDPFSTTISESTTSDPFSSTTPSDPFSSTTPSDPFSSTTPSDPFSSTTPSDPFSSTTPSDPFSSTTPSDSFSSTTPSDPFSSTTPSDSFSSTTSSDPFSSTTSSDPFSSTTPSDSFSSTTPSDPFSSTTPSDPFSSTTSSTTTSSSSEGGFFENLFGSSSSSSSPSSSNNVVSPPSDISFDSDFTKLDSEPNSFF